MKKRLLWSPWMEPSQFSDKLIKFCQNYLLTKAYTEVKLKAKYLVVIQFSNYISLEHSFVSREIAKARLVKFLPAAIDSKT
jgi:hypothetical protein